MQKGERATLYVSSINYSVRQTKQQKFINHIKFATDGRQAVDGHIPLIIYEAEEMSDHRDKSEFPETKLVTFECTNPGAGDKLDWVRLVSVDAPAATNGHHQLNRDNLIVAQHGFNAAVQLGIRLDWSEETILNKALEYATKIKSIAEVL